MPNNQGRGSNLTDEDRAKGGENSHSGGRSSNQNEQYNSDVTGQGGSKDTNPGNFANRDPEEVKEAGREGGSK